MSVIILVAAMAVALVILAIVRRIDWFSLLEWRDKNEGQPYSAYLAKRVNDGSGVNKQALFERANLTVSVINDGYGDKNEPYEYWARPLGNSEREWADYIDVVGYQTRAEVAKMVRRHW